MIEEPLFSTYRYFRSSSCGSVIFYVMVFKKHMHFRFALCKSTDRFVKKHGREIARNSKNTFEIPERDEDCSINNHILAWFDRAKNIETNVAMPFPLSYKIWDVIDQHNDPSQEKLK